MILLFTSDHCTWCDVLKSMLQEEWNDLGISEQIHEVDVEKHTYIAEAYGILVVPTLVTGNQKISGVPSSDDLRSFLIQAISHSGSMNVKKTEDVVFKEIREIRGPVQSEQQVLNAQAS